MKPPLRRWSRRGVPLLSIMSHHRRGYHQPPARHQEHEVIVATGGEGTYRLGETTTRVAAGEILIMPAGTIHEIRVTDHLRLAAIHLHPAAFEVVTVRRGPQAKLLAGLSRWDPPLPWRKVVAPDTHATLERLAEEAVVEQHRQGPAQRTLLGALAAQAAVHLVRLMLAQAGPEAADTSVRAILTVRSWIDRHFAEDCGVVSLAKRAHLAPTYFAARFRAVVGVPPMTYVRNRRIDQARLLLARTGQPVKAVAWSVGYRDVSHFTRAFKQATGLTPQAYRPQAQADR
ncbi:MAG: AraC family transcriptional regulator [Planctomycetota bacterium]